MWESYWLTPESQDSLRATLQATLQEQIQLDQDRLEALKSEQLKQMVSAQPYQIYVTNEGHMVPVYREKVSVRDILRVMKNRPEMGLLGTGIFTAGNLMWSMIFTERLSALSAFCGWSAVVGAILTLVFNVITVYTYS